MDPQMLKPISDQAVGNLSSVAPVPVFLFEVVSDLGDATVPIVLGDADTSNANISSFTLAGSQVIVHPILFLGLSDHPVQMHLRIGQVFAS